MRWRISSRGPVIGYGLAGILHFLERVGDGLAVECFDRVAGRVQAVRRVVPRGLVGDARVSGDGERRDRATEGDTADMRPHRLDALKAEIDSRGVGEVRAARARVAEPGGVRVGRELFVPLPAKRPGDDRDAVFLFLRDFVHRAGHGFEKMRLEPLRVRAERSRAARELRYVDLNIQAHGSITLS